MRAVLADVDPGGTGFVKYNTFLVWWCARAGTLPDPGNGLAVRLLRTKLKLRQSSRRKKRATSGATPRPKSLTAALKASSPLGVPTTLRPLTPEDVSRVRTLRGPPQPDMAVGGGDHGGGGGAVDVVDEAKDDVGDEAKGDVVDEAKAGDNDRVSSVHEV